MAYRVVKEIRMSAASFESVEEALEAAEVTRNNYSAAGYTFEDDPLRMEYRATNGVGTEVALKVVDDNDVVITLK